MPLTPQNRDSDYKVVLPKLRFLYQDSAANVKGIGSIPTARLERKLGELPDDVLIERKRAIAFAVELEVIPELLDH